MPEEQPISEAFGNFVAAATWDDLDDPIRHEAKRSILNFFATCGRGGSCPDRSAASRTEPRQHHWTP
jgi:hypothetical protein